MSSKLQEKFAMASDHQRYHATTVSPQNLFVRKFNEGKGSRNNIVLCIAWSVCLCDLRRIAIAKTIADELNQHFESDVVKEYNPELKIKQCGY